MTAAKLKRLKALHANRDDDFWKWRDFVEAIGIEATLEGLGFPLDRKHFGTTRTLAVSKRSTS
jgi:hypothetical protein